MLLETHEQHVAHGTLVGVSETTIVPVEKPNSMHSSGLLISVPWDWTLRCGKMQER